MGLPWVPTSLAPAHLGPSSGGPGDSHVASLQEGSLAVRQGVRASGGRCLFLPSLPGGRHPALRSCRGACGPYPTLQV